ncbi:DsbA family protein [Kushneria phyllosphaerae]|uniref:DsbA family protein n=1 Tax=Kushneria phyllosphaerae TaxID=2100822 RepID=UPI002434140F|nr:thioredoxin domain-containing protein [Kushneria phyllosphaerae]
MTSAEVQTVIDQNMTDVSTNQIRQTPTFFVNGESLDPFGMQELIDAVESEIEEISEEEDGQ